MSKHTPGPWKSTGFIVISQTAVICDAVIEANSDIPYEEKADNARLIAAAPDLLKALNALAQSCHNEFGPRFRESTVGKNALAAVAKAEGGHE